MKAVYLERFGGPEVLQYGDLPDPVAGPGEVVIDVAAASVNAADWKFRSGQYARHSGVKFPLIPGRDFSGSVSAVGGGVADLKVGDPVFGVLDIGREGTLRRKTGRQICHRGQETRGLVARRSRGCRADRAHGSECDR
jgi:NADPH:quinone reductase-like Zn-dependent oxidoreductase